MSQSLHLPLPQIVTKLVEHGLSESDIAMKIGSSQSTINRARRGKPVHANVSDGLRQLHYKIFGALPVAAEPPDTSIPIGQVIDELVAPGDYHNEATLAAVLRIPVDTLRRIRLGEGASERVISAIRRMHAERKQHENPCVSA